MPFLCYDRLDLVRPWGLLVTGLAEVGVVACGTWWMGCGAAFFIFFFISFFSSMGLCMAGWLAWE